MIRFEDWESFKNRVTGALKSRKPSIGKKNTILFASVTDYQKFMTLVSSDASTKAGATKLTFAKKSQLIVAKTDVFIRTSPDASYHEAFYQIGENNNIIRKATVGEFLCNRKAVIRCKK